MKKFTAMLKILLCVLLAAPASAEFAPQATAIPGSVPEGISYQGRLEDGGFPVNGTKTMVFRIYSAVSGGVLLWTGPAQSVPVSIGLFNASVPVPVTTLVGGGARYLEAQIDGTIMAPRELLNSVPYALIAKSVEGTIDVSTAGLAINANSAATQPALYISSNTGNVGIGTGSPSTSFDVGGSAQFGSGATKSTFTATGALNAAAMITAPSYTATYGLAASTAVIAYLQASSITITNGTAGLKVGAARLTDDTLTLTATAVQANVASPGQVSLISAVNTDITLSDAGGFMRGKVNGTEFWRQTAGGFGLGTASPASKLHMSSGTLIIDGNTPTALTTVGSVGIGTGTPTSPNAFIKSLEIAGTSNASLVLSSIGGAGTRWEMGSENTAGGLLGIFSGTSRIMSLLGGGSVGIGTSIPATTLDVAGSAQFGSAATKSTFTAAGVLNLGGALNVAGIATFTGDPVVTHANFPVFSVVATDNTFARLRLQNSDNGWGVETRSDIGVGAGGYCLENLGSSTFPFCIGANNKIITGAGAPLGRFDVRSNDEASAYVLSVSSQSAAMMFGVTGAGNVGIGTSPSAKLDINQTNAGVNALNVLFNVGANPASAAAYFKVQQPTNMPVLRLDTATGGNFSESHGLMINNEASGAGIRILRTSVTQFAVNADGSVGVGTVGHAASKLHMSSGTLTIDGSNASSIQTIGNVGVGTGASAPNDRLEVAGGNVRLTAVAGAAGSVKLFSILTVGATACTGQCGANTTCLAAWDSSGNSSTCGSAAANNRCLCSGFGN